MTRAQRGFTLLEIMVSLVIFALVSLSGMLLLQGTLRNSDRIRTQSENFGALQRTFLLMERDFAYAIARPEQARHDKTLLPEMRYENQDGANSGVTFLRANKLNPGGYLSRSTLQWVRWRSVNGKLMRASAPYQQGEFGLNTKESLLLANVSAFRVRFARQGWMESWHATATLPEAVEITLTTRDFGTITRLFLVSGAK
ncbi:type II secretion system minor pseudopilin GspJ [Kalamiella sp. sgz302252]|uniref:type II secretion system minor pseudopilin GspJ n=1 Tax=Pantoea sp. sgz302252 TaxID=3341827 RepID=UPI0036D25E49